MKREITQPMTAMRVTSPAQRRWLAFLPSPSRLRLRASPTPQGIVEFRMQNGNQSLVTPAASEKEFPSNPQSHCAFAPWR